jgi:hypothetical protein
MYALTGFDPTTYSSNLLEKLSLCFAEGKVHM